MSPARYDVPVATHVIDRPRLFTRLDRGAAAGTALVAATAGWGKTLLVASWIAASTDDVRVVWVNLDRADDGERDFWRTVATALLRVLDEPGSQVLRRVVATDETELPSLFATAVRQLPCRVVLVLDNLHEVRAPEVHDGLLRLVEHPLPNLSLIVTTRCDPPWPLRRVRLTGVLAEVRAADLAFRADEASALFGSLGLRLTEGQVDRLVERTDGWAAGLRLAALHLLNCDDVESAVANFSGDDHSVAGYLLTEVLDRQAPELLAFLEAVSVVDEVNAALADALTGGNDGQAKLTELESALLFVEAVGRSGRWYRMHRMVADILRARPATGRQRRDRCRRAAEWYVHHDMPLDAIKLALRGELWPLAAELVGRNLVSITMQGGAHRLERLLTDVPRTAVLSRPELAVGLAGARVVRGSGQEVAGLIEAARAGASRLSPVRGERLAVLLALVEGALARLVGDFDAMAAAYRNVSVEPAALARLGMTAVEIVRAVALNNVGTAEVWGGDLSGAAVHLAAAVQQGTDGPTLTHLNASGYLALLHCERGELTVAEAAARAAADTATRLGWATTPQAVGAYLTMARVLLDRDEPAGLDPWLQRVVEVAAVAPEPHIRLALALVLAARRQAAGDCEHALTTLRTTNEQLGVWRPPRGLAEQRMLAEAALRARLGDVFGARRVIHAHGPPRTAAGVIGRARLQLLLGDVPTLPVVPDADLRTRIALDLVEAVLASRDGDGEHGLECLEQALLAAAPGRMRRPFLVDAVELRALLLRRIEHGSAESAFALDLLRRMSGSDTDEPSVRLALIDPLTEREQTVLRYLASSLSNAEIARELYVSINTVKTHQRTVYRKLGADGRRDAVRRARTLRLL